VAASKKDPEAKAEKAPAVPVRVDNSNARSDKDAYEGGAVKVVAGDHGGAVGVFQSVSDYADDGYPENVLVSFTDPVYHTQLAVLPYADVVPATYVEPDAKAAKYAADEAQARVMTPDQPAAQTADTEN
jgi:hypothetical protein